MTEPTDDEIAALRSEFGITSNGRGIKEFTQVRDFARAVLAKWGVLRAEKIVIPTDTMEQEFQKHYRRGYEAGKKATTSQPTQAQAGAVPPEAEPIVLNCEAPGDLKPGDYVFASRWSDCDPGDPWEVGFVSEVGVYPESMTKAGYVVLQGGSRRWGRAMRITPEQGRRICEQFPSMERLQQDYDAIARVFGIKGGQHVS